MKKFSFHIIPFILLNMISVLLVVSWTYGATREWGNYRLNIANNILKK